MRRLVGWAAWAVLLAKLLPAAEADSERAAWRYRRPVAGPDSGELLALPLPPELQGHAQPGLADLRLVSADGRELPYVVDRIETRESASSFRGALVDQRRELSGPRDEERGETTLLVDFGEPRRFDTIVLEVKEQDFAKRVRVEASADRDAWTLLDADAGIFDGSWGGRVHHTTLQPRSPATARFLRLSLGDRRGSPPIRITGVTVSALRRAEGDEWRQEVALRSVPGARPTRYRLDPGLPLEALELDCDDPAFHRRVKLLEVKERAGRPEEKVLAEATLYRLRLPEPRLVGEERRLRLAAAATTAGAALVLEVDDGDSPPLRNLRAVASGAAVRLVFPAVPSALLYYGNEATRAPLYDLQSLKAQLRFASGLGAATLGEETENPLYRRPEPIPFVALRGSSLELGRWRSLRRFGITGAPDIWALTLSPPDLALARADVADLRLVAEDGAQVPYLLEPGPSGALSLEVETLPTERTGRGVWSPYGLRVPGLAEGRSQGIALSALELSIVDAFFERPVRLVAPREPGATAVRTLYSGTLSHRPRAESRGAELVPLVLPLDGSRLAELTLEISDGDNAPLTLAGVVGRVSLPRLVFKAEAGSYRLLLGNPDAAAPRYDLLSLRQEVLAYSARSVEASPAEPNPAFRRSAADYFQATPPTALLWGALVVAVAALLFLTARILRSQP